MLVLVLLGCQALASEFMSEMQMNDLHIMIEPPPWGGQELLLFIQKRNMSVHSWFLPTREFDVNKFVAQLEKTVGPFESRQLRKSYVGGGIWIRGTLDEFMLSAYMHPTRQHRAGIRSGATGKILPDEFVWTDARRPGNWFIAVGNPHSSYGNEPLYMVE